MNSQNTNHGSIFGFYSLVSHLEHNIGNVITYLAKKYIREHPIADKRKQEHLQWCRQTCISTQHAGEDDTWLYPVKCICKNLSHGPDPHSGRPDGHRCHKVLQVVPAGLALMCLRLPPRAEERSVGQGWLYFFFFLFFLSTLT